MKTDKSASQATSDAFWEGLVIGSIIVCALVSVRNTIYLDRIEKTLTRIEKQAEPKDDSVTLEKETGE